MLREIHKYRPYWAIARIRVSVLYVCMYTYKNVPTPTYLLREHTQIQHHTDASKYTNDRNQRVSTLHAC